MPRSLGAYSDNCGRGVNARRAAKRGCRECVETLMWQWLGTLGIGFFHRRRRSGPAIWGRRGVLRLAHAHVVSHKDMDRSQAILLERSNLCRSCQRRGRPTHRCACLQHTTRVDRSAPTTPVGLRRRNSMRDVFACRDDGGGGGPAGRRGARVQMPPPLGGGPSAFRERRRAELQPAAAACNVHGRCVTSLGAKPCRCGHQVRLRSSKSWVARLPWTELRDRERWQAGPVCGA